MGLPKKDILHGQQMVVISVRWIIYSGELKNNKMRSNKLAVTIAAMLDTHTIERLSMRASRSLGVLWLTPFERIEKNKTRSKNAHTIWSHCRVSHMKILTKVRQPKSTARKSRYGLSKEWWILTLRRKRLAVSREMLCPGTPETLRTKRPLSSWMT